MQRSIEWGNGKTGVKCGNRRGEVLGKAIRAGPIEGQRRIANASLPQLIEAHGGFGEPAASRRGIVASPHPFGEASFRLRRQRSIIRLRNARAMNREDDESIDDQKRNRESGEPATVPARTTGNA